MIKRKKYSDYFNSLFLTSTQDTSDNIKQKSKEDIEVNDNFLIKDIKFKIANVNKENDSEFDEFETFKLNELLCSDL